MYTYSIGKHLYYYTCIFLTPFQRGPITAQKTAGTLAPIANSRQAPMPRDVLEVLDYLTEVYINKCVVHIFYEDQNDLDFLSKYIKKITQSSGSIISVKVS